MFYYRVRQHVPSIDNEKSTSKTCHHVTPLVAIGLTRTNDRQPTLLRPIASYGKFSNALRARPANAKTPRMALYVFSPAVNTGCTSHPSELY